MRCKTVLHVALLSLVALTLTVSTVANLRRPAPADEQAEANRSRPDRLVVYCFHAAVRCPTCLNMEACAREAVEGGFADWLARGRIEFRSVDVQRRENEHFCDDYQLVGPEVVFVQWRDGREQRRENLVDSVALLGDKTRFIRRVQERVRAMAEDSPAIPAGKTPPPPLPQ